MWREKKSRLQMFGAFMMFFVLLVIDRLTKHAAAVFLQEKDAFVVIPGIFELRYLENRGAAFGALQNQRALLLCITVAILLALCVLYIKIPADRKYLPLRLTAVLLVAGAVGNLIDRFFHRYVIDFFYVRCIDFPIFNVADCYVVVAACLAFYLICFHYEDSDFAFLKRKRER